MQNLENPHENADFCTKLKTLDFVQLYTKGKFLDVYDSSENTWRVAKITDLSQNYAKISYDGWKSVYDEVIYCEN